MGTDFFFTHQPAIMTTSEQFHQPLTNEDLDQLEQFLVSDQTPDECLSSLEMVDGYMTALVIGPELVKPSLWIPHLLNPENVEQPLFADENQAEAITSLLLRHMNTIDQQFTEEPEGFFPLYEKFSYSDEEDLSLAIEEWALGFIIGMELNHEAWQPLFANEESAMLAGPIFILAKITDDYETMSQEEVEQLNEFLDESIIRMFYFWQQQENEE